MGRRGIRCRGERILGRDGGYWRLGGGMGWSHWHGTIRFTENGVEVSVSTMHTTVGEEAKVLKDGNN